MIVLAGADVVLPDRVLSRGTVVLDGDRIAAVEPRIIDTPSGAVRVDVSGCSIVPGFIDVHVHGVLGIDVLDDAHAIAAVASRLPAYGVTAFCPTSVACDPARLRSMLQSLKRARAQADATSAQVLPAHLESNFINPDYKGAQPGRCLRTLRSAGGEFTGHDIVDVITAHGGEVGIVTVAPELDGGFDLVATLTAGGHIVSIGHSGATYEEARAAIAAGVRHATHLFNRMTPMTHRAPGVAGAVLEAEDVTAELIADGFHVHPVMMRLAIRAKGIERIMAITDGTAGSGLAVGSVTRLGGEPITVTERTAVLADGTLAGSILTMDGAFRNLVNGLGLTMVDAARLCSTTPARQLGLPDRGRIAVGCQADVVVLDSGLQVRQTYLRGARWRNPSSPPLV
jgi:N-acetylglucosamine-6-phosphate deacetylase